MNASGTVIVFFGENLDYLGPKRPKQDIIIDDRTGAMLTWRREGQTIPGNMQEVVNFDVCEAQYEHSIVLVERLMKFCQDRDIDLDQGFLMLVVAKIHKDIRDAVAQHEHQWGYFPTRELVSR